MAMTSAAELDLGSFANLELRHLVALDAVATEGTFGRAAVRLGYTQSAVSQQIAALEKAIGGTVFDRPGGPRPVMLTALGRLVLDRSRELLVNAAQAAAEIDGFRTGSTGRIDVGTFQSVSAVLLPAIVSRVRDDLPGVDIRIHEDEVNVLPRVLAGELDLAFTVAPTRSDLHAEKLFDDPYLLVARRGEFPSGTVPVERLDGVQMVGFPSWCDMNQVHRELSARGVRPTIVFETVDNGTIQAMVRAGMGPAIMSLLCVNIAPDDDHLELHRLEPPIPPRQIELAWLPGRDLSPAAQHLVDLAKVVAADHAAAHAAEARHRSRA